MFYDPFSSPEKQEKYEKMLNTLIYLIIIGTIIIIFFSMSGITGGCC